MRIAPSGFLATIKPGSFDHNPVVGDDSIVTARRTVIRHAAILRILTFSFLGSPAGIWFYT
jgi:hypothetical protein